MRTTIRQPSRNSARNPAADGDERPAPFPGPPQTRSTMPAPAAPQPRAPGRPETSASGARHARLAASPIARPARNGQAVCHSPARLSPSLWVCRPMATKREYRSDVQDQAGDRRAHASQASDPRRGARPRPGSRDVACRARDANMLRAHVLPCAQPPPPGAPGAMIVVVSLDPSVQVSYETTPIVPGSAHTVEPGPLPGFGGRGPAVARMLHYFGHEVVAAGLAGGTAGELIRAELSRLAVPTPVHADRHGKSRRVVEVSDGSARPGDQFRRAVPVHHHRGTRPARGRLPEACSTGPSAVVLCGGLPDGLPPRDLWHLHHLRGRGGRPGDPRRRRHRPCGTP